jgi:hypothetical protein
MLACKVSEIPVGFYPHRVRSSSSSDWGLYDLYGVRRQGIGTPTHTGNSMANSEADLVRRSAAVETRRHTI